MDKAFNGLLFSRHSIRKYTDKPIPPSDVKQILEAALLAPSSKSSRPWQFVAVETPQVLEAMSKCKSAGAKPIANAVLAIVVCADPEKSDVFVEDCAVAASYMQLQAEALGIGSCWVQIRNRYSAEDEPAQDVIKGLLDIPDNMQVVMVVTFGYSAENRKPVDPEKLLWEKVHIEKWSAPQE